MKYILIIVLKSNLLELELKLKEGKYLNMNLIEIKSDPNLISNNTIMEDLLLDCHCALFFIDISDQKGFESIKNLMDLIDNKFYPDLKKILVENKSDIEPELPSEDIYKYINDNPVIDHIKISVKDGKNLEELKLKIYNEINSPNKNITPLDILKKSDIKSDLKNINIEGNMKIITLVLLGNTGVGKTSFMKRYTANDFSQRFISTIGINEVCKIIEIKDENNNIKNYKLKIFDTAGQEKYRSIPRSYYKKADGILLFYDVNDIETFEAISTWIIDIKDELAVENENKVVIYLVGNKIDFLNNDEEEIGESNEEDKHKPVTKKEKEDLINKLKLPYYEISNQWNLNVDEVSARIVLDVAKIIDNKNEDVGRKTITSNNGKKKKKCCK